MSDKTRSIVSAKAKPPATLLLRWSDGTKATINFGNVLGKDLGKFGHKRGFRALRDEAEFAQVKLGEWGHSLAWPSGAELSAQTLWLETLSANGQDDTRAFLEWRLRHALSLTKAAEALGLSRRMIAYYSNGEKPVPKAILLACKGWEVSHAV
jgi:hypothetical protein